MSVENSGQVWLFGARTDVLAFAGSALISVAFVALGSALGVEEAFPLWAWLLFVVGIDVAHVWSTIFRVYLDGEELQRRAALYWSVPLLVYAVGFAAYQASPLVFWRLFAYAALWHFIRQQYGWIALYNRRARSPLLDVRLDAAVMYAATLGPALWWHANLPRPFWWFVEHDFAGGLPRWVGTAALGLHWAVIAVWAARQLQLLVTSRTVQAGKVLLVIATWIAWYGGIVLARSDFAFTVMNVVLHGVPYFVLLFRYAKGRYREGGYGARGSLLRWGAPGFLLLLVGLAFFEEFLWDRAVWHERDALFGLSGEALSNEILAFVVPLLALPQATHYVLDAFIWRARQDPALLSRLGWAAPRPERPTSLEPSTGNS